MASQSCKQQLNQGLFVGSWEQFSSCYPDSALEYTQQKTYDSALAAADHVVVFYYISTKQHISLLHEYAYLFFPNSLLIIILASHVKIHIFDALSLQNIKVHLVVKEAASCVYEQEIENNHDDVMRRQFTVTAHNDARVDYYVLYSGNASIMHTYYSECLGSAAQTFLRGVFCVTRNQKVTIESIQRHVYPTTQSDVLLKGFAAQSASVFYKGMITIDKEAVHTIARQEHKTLLLSDKASVESIPVLEVLNKEVQCFHASAIGMLDEGMLFYLQSRGLSREKARQKLLMSYAESVYKNDQTFFNIKKKLALLVNSFDLL